MSNEHNPADPIYLYDPAEPVFYKPEITKEMVVAQYLYGLMSREQFNKWLEGV